MGEHKIEKLVLKVIIITYHVTIYFLKNIETKISECTGKFYDFIFSNVKYFLNTR